MPELTPEQRKTILRSWRATLKNLKERAEVISKQIKELEDEK